MFNSASPAYFDVIRSIFPALKRFGRVTGTAALCVLLVEQPLLAEAAVKKNRVQASHEIQGQERVLHALNRLTFGPRSGDLAAVQKMGLDAWFEQQLNPSAIDDSKLDAILAEYPAMQMRLEDLERKYPGPQRLKQMIDGKVALPSDATERAMVEDQIAFYKIGVARREADKGDGGQASMQGRANNGVSPQATSNKNGSGDDAAETQTAMVSKPEMAGDQAGKVSPAGEEPGTATKNALKAREQDTYSRAEVERLLSLSPEERVKAVLALPAGELVRFRSSLRPAELGQLVAGLKPVQREMLMALAGSLRMVSLEAMESRLMRDIESDRQLEAVMTDFWLNHFNVYLRKNQNEPYLIPAYERETIRAHALGKFEDLLVATARSPAMLVYLDNFRSTGPNSVAAGRARRLQEMKPNAPLGQFLNSGLNENYGRELMELHTLGVNGGYTQADVTSVAKVFTGWSVDRPFEGGEYKFEERKHEPGPKTVLGKTIADGGEREGLEVLHLLATSPATAHFISEKLAVRFVSDVPPPALVERMAASFLKSKGDIKVVLRTMFQSTEFWAPEVYRAKVKTPLEFVVSAARASDLQIADAQGLVQSLEKLGMPLYGMPTPNGYSWKQEDWVSTGSLVSRMNFSLVLSADKLPGTRTAWPALLGEQQTGMASAVSSQDDPSPAAAKEAKLEKTLLGDPVSERTRATVLRQSTDTTVAEQAEVQFDLKNAGQRKYAPRAAALGRSPGGSRPADPQLAVMAGLLLGSPEFQRR